MPETIQGTIACIAILDDDADFRTYLEDFLSDESIYAVRAFGSARDLFESCEESLPDIVLLDEPFSALDSQTRLALADEVSEILRSERKTAILVTHDIGEAISMAERVLVMSRGPGRLKSEHVIALTQDGLSRATRPKPFEARSTPEFTDYFNSLWRELDVHVHG